MIRQSLALKLRARARPSERSSRSMNSTSRLLDILAKMKPSRNLISVRPFRVQCTGLSKHAPLIYPMMALSIRKNDEVVSERAQRGAQGAYRAGELGGGGGGGGGLSSRGILGGGGGRRRRRKLLRRKVVGHCGGKRRREGRSWRRKPRVSLNDREKAGWETDREG